MAKSPIDNEVPLDVLEDFFYDHEQGVVVILVVKPHAKNEKLSLNKNADLVLSIKAVAHENKANIRLKEVLASLFLLPKSKIHILRGEHSRYKRILFKGVKKHDLF